jgi:adenosylhomocysteine nucleosidase
MRFLVPVIALCAGCATASRPAVIIVSADAEWRVVRSLHSRADLVSTPYGETFSSTVATDHGTASVVFMHGGWGKIAAAGSAQYAIDRWHPSALINLGTAGGFAGLVERFAMIMPDRTVVYDIVERMGDARAALDAYATTIDLAWLGEPPSPVKRTVLVSADQDLDASALSTLNKEYGAVAGDWESGAIAWVARRNGVRLLILRGVSDLVSSAGGEAYGDEKVFVDGTTVVMKRLDAELPRWLDRILTAR